jgi:hypothetical protein
MGRGAHTKTKKHGAKKNRRITTGKPIPSRQEHGIRPIITGPPGQVKYGTVLAEKLHEFKKGRLRNRAGKVVTRRNQAVNIARYEARLAGAREVPVEGKAEKTKRAEAAKRRRSGLQKPSMCLVMPRPRGRKAA